LIRKLILLIAHTYVQFAQTQLLHTHTHCTLELQNTCRTDDVYTSIQALDPKLWTTTSYVEKGP